MFRAIIIAIIIAAYIILVNIWFDHYISKPIEDLSESARHIADGSYGAQVQSVGDNEIGRLTEDINIMSEKIARSDKATAEFISQISHELRTPLTAILGWSETLQYDPAIKDESLRGVKIISKEAERLTPAWSPIFWSLRAFRTADLICAWSLSISPPSLRIRCLPTVS